MRQAVSRLVYRYRRVEIVLLHMALVVFANYLSFLLRFGGQLSTDASTWFLDGLPWLVAIRMLAFIPFRLYEGLWRYTGVWDLRNIVGAVTLSTLAFYGWARWGLGLVGYPATALVVDSLLLIFFTGGVRLVRRVHRGVSRLIPEKRVLVYGAGDAGEMIVREMRNHGFYEYEPLGFIDDDPAKVGRRIHGVKVLGTRGALAHVMATEKVDMVLVAVPRAEPETIRSIVRALEPFKVPIQTLPNLREVLNGRVSVSQIRQLSVEDLLDRAPVGLDVERVPDDLVAGKRVLITGAGGSIGSELSRQIGALGPAGLILLDRYENGLHALMIESRWRQQTYPVRVIVGDVANAVQMTALLAAHRPDIVFHAAAHKHVPLMEWNACEAVKNNVRGTRIMAETAQRFGVDRFVLISTDKAVNPVSVMGATKRVAEMLIQGMSDGRGVCSAVRFGNVLASNGSVVPQFLAQIERGGPVTVTHPEVRRYFMLISEAVHLVLQAATLAKGGDIFVLEMGEQILVLDLARNLVRLSGLVPDQDIAIAFTGLRPGEKLSEELVGGDEVAEPTAASGILRVQLSAPPEWSQFLRQVKELERLAETGDEVAVIAALCELVPTYRPGNPSES